MADNDILKEQRKARQDFLNLKKMQHGEMSPGPKPSEIAIKPQTFEEKRKNFWFHYKWHIIGISFIVIAITVMLVQCMKREKSDLQIVYFSYEVCLETQIEKVEKYIEKYATDIDGDGKVNVKIVNCSFAQDGEIQFRNDTLTKVQTQIIGNKHALLYIMDKQAFEYLNGVVEEGVFEGEEIIFEESFFEKTETEEYGRLPKGLGMYLRRINGTIFEDDNQAKLIHKESKNIIEKIKNEP